MAGLQNVNLMGPNPAQPMDIQTAQAQLQLQQQIAQALLASGMSPTSMLDTGLVKSANWGDALGKMAEVYFGRKALDQIGGAQQGLAQEQLSRTSQGITDLLQSMNSHVTTDEQGNPVSVQPADPLGGIARAYGTGVGDVKDIAKALLSTGAAMAPKINELKAELSKYYTKDSIENAVGMGSNQFGMPFPSVDMHKLVRMPAVTEARGPTASLSSYDPEVGPVAGPAQQVPPNEPTSGPPRNIGTTSLAPPPQPLVMPGEKDPRTQQVNTLTVPARVNVVTNQMEPVPEAANLPAAHEATALQKELQANYNHLNDAVAYIPRLTQVVNLAGRAITGGWSNLRTEIEQTALQLGMTHDEISAVPSTQSLIALMLPRAAAELKTISPRASEKIIQMVAQANAAGAEADPRHIVDIAGNAIAQIMTDVNVHNTRDVPLAAKSDLGQRALKYQVQFPELPLPQDSPLNIQKQGNTYINQGLTTPRPFGQAAALRTKVVNGTTYVDLGGGRWGVAEPKSLKIE